MLDLALELQQRYENSASAERRKQRGQVFTPPVIARFMAGLLTPPADTYHLLDPGAGIGTLTAAFCERVTEATTPCHLVAHLFESDPELVPLLTQTLKKCRHALSRTGHRLDYVIHEKDFITEAAAGLDGQRTFDDEGFAVRFDGAIMNPPYFKVRKDSNHAKLMARIVHGQPNMYAFFMALGARLLKEHGELVAITPRSFCNGLYFRSFRRWYFQRMALDHVHLFESRTDTFKHSGVLQESMISKSHRFGQPAPRIVISTSFAQDLRGGMEKSSVPCGSVIDDSCGDFVIRIPGSADDRGIMELVESLPTRFSDLGLRISTGPVVMFRATEFLLDDVRDEAAVPLLLPHNVKPYATVWPVRKTGKPVAFRLCDESLRLLVPVKNYVLVKRFSAKEERRRLTAGCLLRRENNFSHLGIENHLNYVYHAERELSEDETYGIAAALNSALLDRYFRTISGNTQVNATEIRAMRFPDLAALARIGGEARRNASEAEVVVMSELGVGGRLRKCLAET